MCRNRVESVVFNKKINTLLWFSMTKSIPRLLWIWIGKCWYHVSCLLLSRSKLTASFRKVVNPWMGRLMETNLQWTMCSWWRHQMKTFLRYWPFVRGIHRSPVNSPHKGQWRGALMFSLICAWMNGWINNREAGDLRRHRVHHDVTVM